ncbi:MAG TPA: hypothetical protein VH206_14420 [Xanthobacteraceae bacterium]|jgi:hypothetical protein|nr:hypothetical protein [Xanthobacteraceae bacterium]
MKTFWDRFRVLVVCFAATVVMASCGDIANTMLAENNWLADLFWTLGLLPMAFLFYRLRSTSRLAYGIFELIVALASLYVGIWKFSHDILYFSAGQALVVWLAFWAAIYFMVRAIDNIGVGLKGSKYEGRWNALFQ